MQLFDVRSASIIVEFQAHTAALNSVQFGPDETSIFTSAGDGMVREWSAHMSGKELWSRQLSDPGSAVSISVSPEGKQLVAAMGQPFFAICSVDRRDEVGGEVHKIGEFDSVVSCVDWSQVGIFRSPCAYCVPNAKQMANCGLTALGSVAHSVARFLMQEATASGAILCGTVDGLVSWSCDDHSNHSQRMR